MDKTKKIGIISGGAGFNNVGDDAQLYNNIRLLKKEGYNSLFVMSPKSYIANLCGLQKVYPSFHSIFPIKYRNNNKYIIEKALWLYYISLDYENKKNLLNKKEKQLLDFLQKMYIIFVSGSGTINTRSIYGLILTILPCLIAKNFRKRIIYSGQGVLPLFNPMLEPLIAYTFNQATLISIRDFDLGIGELRRINVNTVKVIKSIDDAFTIPKKQTDKFNLPNNTIVINISKYLSTDKYIQFYELANKLKTDGYNVVFSIFQNEIKEAEIITKKEFPIYNFYQINPEEVMYFYSQIKASISMRYHSFIFSLANQKPSINIFINDYQESKIRAIQLNTNLPECMLNLNQINIDILYSMLLKAIKLQPLIINNFYSAWTKKANYAIKFLETIE